MLTPLAHQARRRRIGEVQHPADRSDQLGQDAAGADAGAHPRRAIRDGGRDDVNVDSAASPGIVDALIRAEAMRTVILLMSGLQNASCYEEAYISAGLSSIARGLFRVRL